MIPASYMFKDAFRQSFYDPDIAEAIERHHTSRGPGLFARLSRHWRRPSAASAMECPTAPASAFQA